MVLSFSGGQFLPEPCCCCPEGLPPSWDCAHWFLRACRRPEGVTHHPRPSPVFGTLVILIMATLARVAFLLYNHDTMDPVVQNGDPVLRKIAEPVHKEEFQSQELISLIERMGSILNGEVGTYSVGVALAAPQIAVSKRIFVVRYDRTGKGPRDEKTTPELGVFINPKIIKSSRRRVPMDEGCLSVRGLYGIVERHDRITVEAYDVAGKKFTRGGGGLLAQIFQHEIGHLDGQLFIDHAEEVWEQPEEVHGDA